MPKRSFNPKRRLAPDRHPYAGGASGGNGNADKFQYTGSPLHKRTPGDFALSPPAAPRPDKSLCDEAGITRRQEAQDLLREGVRRGLVSPHEPDSFPQNVWAVTEGGVALEAQLENQEQGTYHGYPMPMHDPFRHTVVKQWNGVA